MSVTITINADTAELAAFELVSFVKSLPTFSAPIVTAPSAPVTVEESKPRSTRTRNTARTEQEPTATKAEESGSTEPEEQPEQLKAFPEVDGEGVPEVTVEELRAKAASVAQSGKQANVKALLTEFGAGSVSAVPADKRAAFMSKLNDLAEAS